MLRRPLGAGESVSRDEFVEDELAIRSVLRFEAAAFVVEHPREQEIGVELRREPAGGDLTGDDLLADLACEL